METGFCSPEKELFKGRSGDLFNALFLSRNKSKKARKEVEIFQNDYPDTPEVLNLLTYLNVCRKRIRQAERLVDENFQKNPDYLFARINYADLCLRRKKLQKIPKLFNFKFNLRDFCPNKKMFHISEFRGFMVMMGHYHLLIQKREAAECYHYLAHRVDPSHPNTKTLQKKLYYKPFYKRFILKIFPY